MVPGCALLQQKLAPPNAELLMVRLDAVGLTEQVFRARLKLSNPNAINLRVAEAGLALTVGGITLGEGRTVEAFSVPANSQEEVEIRIVANLLQNAPELWRWFTSGATELEYLVEGFVDPGMAGFARINVNETGRISPDEFRNFPL